jgi:hypothetical protein
MSRVKHCAVGSTGIRAHVRWRQAQAQIWQSPLPRALSRVMTNDLLGFFSCDTHWVSWGKKLGQQKIHLACIRVLKIHTPCRGKIMCRKAPFNYTTNFEQLFLHPIITFNLLNNLF